MTNRRSGKPGRARSALLILDMISRFDFPDGRSLITSATRAANHIAELKQRARRAQWPVIYVNDTAEKWESDPQEFVRRCGAPRSRGRRIVELIAPTESDFFIFKPRHSAFFETPLHSLLERLRISRLCLTGTTSHQCVLFTAMDAHIRGYEVVVPRQCIAAPRRAQTSHALAILVDAVNASIV
jgi:nicotinamidase-related amidase